MSTTKLIQWPSFLTKIGISGLPSLFIALALSILPIQQGLKFFWSGSSTLIAYLILVPAIIVLLLGWRKFSWEGFKIERSQWPVVISLTVILVLSAVQLVIGTGDRVVNTIYLSILLLMYCLFTVSLYKGKDFIALIPYALFIFSLSVFLTGLVKQGDQSSGLSSGPNTVAAFLTVGIFLLKGYWRVLIPFILLSLVFTGCYWCIPVLVTVGLYKLFTLKERSLALIIGFSVIVILVFTFLYSSVNPEGFSSIWRLDAVSKGISDLSKSTSTTEALEVIGSTSLRAEPILSSISNASLLGHGWQPAVVTSEGFRQIGRYTDAIHNVPLMVLDELGLIAMLAWFFTMVYLMIRSKEYKAPLIAIFIFSCTGIYDFWWFNSLMALFFVVIGLATADLSKRKELGNVEVSK